MQFLTTDSKGIHVEHTHENLDCFIKLFALLYADDTILLCESPEDLQIKRCSIYYINTVTGGNCLSTHVKLRSWFFQKVHLESNHLNGFLG